MADPVRAVVAAEHPVLRGVIDSACRDAHGRCAKVETAAATVDACRETRPDLLILDLDLRTPTGSGSSRTSARTIVPVPSSCCPTTPRETSCCDPSGWAPAAT